MAAPATEAELPEDDVNVVEVDGGVDAAEVEGVEACDASSGIGDEADEDDLLAAALLLADDDESTLAVALTGDAFAPADESTTEEPTLPLSGMDTAPEAEVAAVDVDAAAADSGMATADSVWTAVLKGEDGG